MYWIPVGKPEVTRSLTNAWSVTSFNKTQFGGDSMLAFEFCVCRLWGKGRLL